MSTTKIYWKGIEELEQDEKFIKTAQNEFKEEIPVDEFLNDSNLSNKGTSRRDFLKFLGFSVTAASLVACETPVTKTIPYVVKPEEITPGVANYYASTFSDGNDYASILVKTREGRPIHISGNKLSGVTKGGVNARINSSVLSLYDSERLAGPLSKGEASDWASIDKSMISKLKSIKAKGGSVRILTNSITSPSTKKVIGQFIASFNSEDSETAANVKHVTYDDISASGMIQANEESFGVATLPNYKFNKAKSIVSIGADFMANWLSSIQYTADYSSTRNPDNAWISRLMSFETTLSLTGSNADQRVPIKASEHGAVIVAVYNAVASKLGVSKISGGTADYAEEIAQAASDLVAAKGSSLVVSGSNSKSDQVVVNGINSILGNYGNTLDIDANVSIKQGDDSKVADLIKEMSSSKVDALIVYGVNPSYTLPGFSDAISKVALKVSLSGSNDETALLCDYVCPDHHYLESWNDASPRKGSYSLCQPTISPLFKTRQGQDSLLKWIGSDTDYRTLLEDNWSNNILGEGSSIDAWNDCLRDGVYEATTENIVDEDAEMMDDASGFTGDLSAAASAISKAATGGTWELVMYQKIGLGNGNQANNPWLQELSDPISKIVWDNYVTMAPFDMLKAGYQQKTGEDSPASVVTLTVDGNSVELPVVNQPGQKAGTVGLALGYGRTNGGKCATEAGGVNAFNFVSWADGNLSYSSLDVTIADAGKTYPIASTQTHHTLMGRDMIKEATYAEYKKNKRAGNPEKLIANYDGEKVNPYKLDLWNDHNISKGHRWGLSIDLSTCNGCSACVTACHSENNVAVVGRDEVRRSRDMSWLRIDRYYTSDTKKNTDMGFIERAKKMEIPSENPQVAFQPLMCQHCNHAPCETVCPVAATTHSNEGLNQMAYNRCVGTRYCANNCPYKVRRFNWFNYNGNSKFGTNPSQDSLARMVLNPDVVVRSRGVMEKCSMCVQKIQGGKLVAKKAGRPVKDSDITTACADACPANAIQFGDLNNESSAIAGDAAEDRAYVLIEELGIQPNIYYKTKVRNNSEA